MIRFALLILLTACTSEPLVPDAQAQLSRIKSDYFAAALVEQAYMDRAPCPAKPVCADDNTVTDVRRSDYDASAAIVTADAERTAQALAEARKRTNVFVAKVGELR